MHSGLRPQFILYLLGIILMLSGFAQLFPAVLDYVDGHQNVRGFLLSAMIIFFIGACLFFSNRGESTNNIETRYDKISVREAFFMTTFGLMAISLASAVPYYYSTMEWSFTDSMFEAVSGMTTTGSSVLHDYSIASRGILLWRSVTQWIGGIGVLAFAIIFLPFLKVGGMQIFYSGVASNANKVYTKIHHVLPLLIYVYVLLTALCALGYFYAGMGWFDAVNHAFTTISTGGFSTHPAGFAHFNAPAMHIVAMVFMIAGAIPFVLYLQLISYRKFVFHRDEQIKVFMILLFFITVANTLWLAFRHEYFLPEALAKSTFTIVSLLTTSGFSSVNYTLWGGLSIGISFFLMYVGGCAGSSSGGMKIMRVVIVAKALINHLKTLTFPSGVFTLKFQNKKVNQPLLFNVMGFLCLYVVCNTVLAVLLALTGQDLLTSISGAAAAIGNIGPGLGSIIGPMGGYSDLNNSAKWLLMAGMVIGRLEIFAVLVIFSRKFWQK